MLRISSLGFRVQVLGFRVQGLGFHDMQFNVFEKYFRDAKPRGQRSIRVLGLRLSGFKVLRFWVVVIRMPGL